MEKIETTLTKLGFEPYYQLPLVQQISQKTKVKPFILVFAFLVMLVILAFTPLGGNALTTLIAFLLPAFKTFEALETEQREDDAELLTYWIVFGLIYSLDELFRYFLAFIPFYHVFRCALLIAIYSPQVNGAQIIYQKAVRPFFMNYRNEIEKVVNPIEERTRSISQNLKKTE